MWESQKNYLKNNPERRKIINARYWQNKKEKEIQESFRRVKVKFFDMGLLLPKKESNYKKLRDSGYYERRAKERKESGYYRNNKVRARSRSYYKIKKKRSATTTAPI